MSEIKRYDHYNANTERRSDGLYVLHSDHLADIEAALAEKAEQIATLIYNLGNLLAIIHGDGGHYQAEQGTEKAVRDAIEKVSTLKIAEETQDEQIAALTAAIAEQDKQIAALEEKLIQTETSASKEIATLTAERNMAIKRGVELCGQLNDQDEQIATLTAERDALLKEIEIKGVSWRASQSKVEGLLVENKRLREALEKISQFDSYHQEWPEDIYVNAPPEEIAQEALRGGEMRDKST